MRKKKTFPGLFRLVIRHRYIMKCPLMILDFCITFFMTRQSIKYFQHSDDIALHDAKCWYQYDAFLYQALQVLKQYRKRA